MDQLIVNTEIKSDNNFIVDGIKFQYPICQKCRKPVDRFKVKVEPNDFKFEAECHFGYEMWRVEKSELENLETIEAGAAFNE